MFKNRLIPLLAGLLLASVGFAQQPPFTGTAKSPAPIAYNAAAQIITGNLSLSSLPPPGNYTGWEAFTSDQGMVFSNGTVWTPLGAFPEFNVSQWSVPVVELPSAFYANNGVVVIGQLPASSATLSVSATSGSVTATFSAATLLGTASDVGRVITINDSGVSVTCTSASPTVCTGDTLPNGTPVTLGGTPPAGLTAGTVYYVVGTATNTFQLAATVGGTALNSTSTGTSVTAASYKYCTITAQSSTTVATCTVTAGTLSSTGAFANANVYISGTVSGVASYSAPLPTVYPNVYLEVPATSYTAANAAGVLYAQCTSTTVCILFNNVLASGAPQVIAAPTSLVSTGQGAVAQSTSAVTLVTIPVFANAIGADGVLSIYTYGLRVNDSNVETETLTFGGTTVGILNTASVIWFPLERQVRNMASASSQIFFAAATSSATDTATNAAAPSYGAVNTTQAQNLVIQGTLATATDYLVITGALVQIEYAP